MQLRSIFICLILASSFLSCKKDQKLPDDPSFGFTGNNVNYKWNFVNAPSFDDRDAFFKKKKSINSNDTVYLLVGRDQTAGVEILCVIPTSVLKRGTYTTITQQSDPYIENLCFLKDIRYGTLTGDYMVVTISSIVNNYASGSFTTVMHDLTSGTQELNIVNGYFNHVLITE